MSFQACLDTIQARTGLGPADLRRFAEARGFTQGGALKSDTKAGAVVQWLKDDYGLGHGHAMAIFALLKGHRKAGTSS